MKMTIITDEAGNVVSTYRHPHASEQAKGKPKLRLHAGPKQSAHEIELPAELEKIESADELHSRLQEFLKTKRVGN